MNNELPMTSSQILTLVLVCAGVFVFLFSLGWIIYKFTRTEKDFPKKIIRTPAPYLLALSLIVMAVAGYLYTINLDKKVFVVSAAEFRRIESEQLERLQSAQTYEEVNKASDKLVLFDIRSEKETFEGQIAGSTSLPIRVFRNGSQKITPVRNVAIYSAKDRLAEATEVAAEMEKQPIPRIYVIKDGFEGMVKAGYKLKENPGFEKE